MSTYYLKYYAEILNFRGQLSRVEILQRDTQPASVLQIGDVCGLALEIQGGQDDVFAPIIKTQARLSMISSDDKPTADGVKYGNWGEFYTPDATLYKMVIMTKTSPSAVSWDTRWTGYITPDSWQEGLEYRSAITIVARDNIGHLQDFEFSGNMPSGVDAYGLISIRDLVSAAMDLVEMPMTLQTNTTPGDFEADGTSVLDSMVQASLFKDDDWFQVIEEVLDAIGYCLRYTDNNRFTLAPVRHIPLLGGTQPPSSSTLEFYGGTGEVVPAAKKVVEEHDYSYEGETNLAVHGDFTIGSSNQYTYKCYIGHKKADFVLTYPIYHDAAPYTKVTNPGNTVWKQGADFWKPGQASSIMRLLEGDGWDNCIFLAANGLDGQEGESAGSDLRTQSLRFHCGTPDVTLRLYFNRTPVTVAHWGSGWDPQPPADWDGVVPMDEPFFGKAGLYKIRYSIKMEHGNDVFWWDNGEWKDTEALNEQEYDPILQTTDVEIPLGANTDVEDDVFITLNIRHIEYMMTGMRALDHFPGSDSTLMGCYARLSNATVEANQTNLAKNTVRTNNDEKNNVIISRRPRVAPLSREVKIAIPASYEDALFYYPTGEDFPKQYPYKGNWNTVSGNVVKPLPVIIHQQLLCYRGASLWELSGECAPENNAMFRFDKLMAYKNRTYLIQSATLDYMTGTVSGIILREFLNYDDVWDDTEQGDWEDDGIYNSIGGGSTGGGSGHGGSTGGGGAYSKNFFEEDGNGGIKLKDEYTGLWTNGFLNAKGAGSGGSGGGGATLDEVWASLTDNTTKPNVTLHTAHIPWASMPVANTATIGGVKVDGTTITIDANGVISATAQGGGSVNSLTVGTTNYTPDSNGVITIPAYPTSLPASDVYSWAKAASKPSYSLSEISGTSDLQAIEALTGTGLLKRTGSNTWALDTSSYLTAVPKATDSVIGGFQTGYSESGKNYAVKMSGNKAYVNVPWTDTVYSLPLAASGTRGGIQVGFSESNSGSSSNRNYAVQLSSEKAYVNVPWTDTVYTHPTGGANTTITAAAGKVLSAIKVDSLGHVSSVSSKTLATTDIPDLSGTYLPLTGGTLTGALRMKPSGANHGGKLNFGDNEYVYLYEDTDDHLKIYASKGLTIDCGSSYSIEIAKALSVSGNVTVGSSASNKNLTIYGTLYFSGSTAYLSYSSANSGIVSSVGIYSNTYVNAAAAASSSDARLKDGITTVSADRAISLLTALRGCEWAWNGKKAYLEGQHGSGLIAQEVQKVMPWMVLDLGGELSLTYNSLWGIAVPVMQSHEERIKALEAEVEDLKKKLNHVA